VAMKTRQALRYEAETAGMLHGLHGLPLLYTLVHIFIAYLSVFLSCLCIRE